MNVWDRLGIKYAEADEKAVKSAYARALKITRPQDDPKGFQELVEARDQALAMVAFKTRKDDHFETLNLPKNTLGADLVEQAFRVLYTKAEEADQPYEMRKLRKARQKALEDLREKHNDFYEMPEEKVEKPRPRKEPVIIEETPIEEPIVVEKPPKPKKPRLNKQRLQEHLEANEDYLRQRDVAGLISRLEVAKTSLHEPDWHDFILEIADLSLFERRQVETVAFEVSLQLLRLNPLMSRVNFVKAMNAEFSWIDNDKRIIEKMGEESYNLLRNYLNTHNPNYVAPPPTYSKPVENWSGSYSWWWWIILIAILSRLMFKFLN